MCDNEAQVSIHSMQWDIKSDNQPINQLKAQARFTAIH